MRDHSIDPGAAAGDGAVYTFEREKDGPTHPQAAGQPGQRRLERGGIVEARELIEGRDGKHASS